MKEFEKGSLPHRAMKIHWKLLQKDSRKLSQKSFYSRTFRQTLTPREAVEEFFGLIEDNIHAVNPAFEKVFKTFRKYKDHVTKRP